MTNIINTLEADVSSYLIGAPAEIITDVEGIFGELTSGADLAALVIDAVPPSAEKVVYNAGTYGSSLLEEILTQILPGSSLFVLLTSVKGQIDGKLPNKAGSDLLRLIPSIVVLAEAYYKAATAPTVAAVTSPASKAVTIKAAIATSQTAYVLTPAEWAAVQASRAQSVTNAAADAPLESS
jgi:hypothetical protein